MGSLFGDEPKVPEPIFPAFTAGGIKTKTNQKGRVSATTLPERQALIDSLSNTLRSAGTSVRGFLPQFESAFGSGVSAINDLLPQVAPGFGRLTDAGVQAINNSRNAAVGDITSNLGKRRVLGSSFGQNLIRQTAQQFADQEEQFRSQSFLEELDLTNRLEQQKTNLEIQGIETALNTTLEAFELDTAADEVQLEEMNNLANIASSMAGQAANIANTNAQAKARAKNESKASLGRLVGSVAGSLIGGPAGGAIGGTLGGAATGGGFDLGSLVSSGISGVGGGLFSDTVGKLGLAGTSVGRNLGGFTDGASVLPSGETIFWR